MTTLSFARYRQVLLAGACLLLVVLAGLLDYHTGYRLSISLFYLVPVLLAAWTIGAKAALAMAAFAMVAWFFADASLRQEGFSNPVVYWNAVMRLGFFAIGGGLLASLRAALDRERSAGRIDHLTGLANVRAFHEDAAAEIARAQRYGHPLTVAYIDLDNFKVVNDLYGHREGDRILRKAAQTIRSALRAHDLVARVGGDEFAALLPETRSGQAKPVFDRLMDRFRQGSKDDSALRYVTASIGVVTFETPPASVAAMVWAADTLMYKVKHTGKNGCNFEIEAGAGSAQRRLASLRKRISSGADRHNSRAAPTEET